MQKRLFETLVSKITACLPSGKVEHEGMTWAGCEKSGRFLRAEMSSTQRPQQKPRGRMKNLHAHGGLPDLPAHRESIAWGVMR